MLNTYLPQKYKVFFGKKTNIGLATCWSNPEKLLIDHSEIYDKIALLGSLYSREGVSIILRNLALNPQIRYLIIWSNSPLSQTEIGRSGFEMLKNLFINGIDLNHQVVNNGGKIHPEISSEIVDKIRANVKLLDLASYSYDEMQNYISQYSFNDTKAYMQSTSFPESKRDTSESWPSESVGWLVRDQKIITTWLKVVDRILRYGHVRKTDWGNLQKELPHVTWVIENEDINNLFIPDWPEEINSICGISINKLEQYKNSLLDPKLPEQTSYTYGYRLRNYQKKIDQINEIIRLLKESIISRRCFATTFIPTEDFFHTSPPCLTSIQAMADHEEKINLFVNLRSHDIFKAAISNAVGLLNLQNFIAKNVNRPSGKLVISSVSAHIYEEDWDMAQKLIDCQLKYSLKPIFDEQTDLDPRGIFRIRLDNQEIIFELLNINSDIIFEYKSSSAINISYTISKMDLLSKPEHYAYLGLELSKAEYCLKKNIVYHQDNNTW